MRTDTAATIHRSEYSPPTYWVDTIDIGFDLDPEATRVAARSVLRRNTEVQSRELVLFGEDLTLVALRMNGRTLGKRDYRLSGGNLIIDNAPDDVTLEIETLIHPARNTSLMACTFRTVIFSRNAKPKVSVKLPISLIVPMSWPNNGSCCAVTRHDIQYCFPTAI